MAHPPFNPLDRKQLARTVAEALLRRPAIPLPLTERFNGAGIYAIYYCGNFEPYATIADLTSEECEIPVYVGKAMPKGGRTGNVETGEVGSPRLFERLNKHAASIRSTNNLRIEDCRCRYLIVDIIWIPLGEQLLIQRFRPIWNRSVLQGFGINDPGRGRANQRRSAWDTVHPGRPYTLNLPPNDRTSDEILQALAEDRGLDLIIEEE